MEWTKQEHLIPNGVQTMSKMPCRYVEGVYPKYIDRAKGAYCYAGDNEYIDYPLALGPLVLGHADERIKQVIAERYGNGHIFSLPHKLEGELAEKLCDIIPCAEKIRFLKSGTEACMAAIKIARAYTGKKIVLTCGYHGWADWYSITTDHKGGCPDSREQEVRTFKYNDIQSLEKVLRKGVAAVIMEPCVFDKPEGGFLSRVRKMCMEKKALLIFDEVVTGFRMPKMFAQTFFGTTPDLCCIGKAMANGLPISAVCGKAEIMDVLEDKTFVSSTFGGDLLGIAAALKTISIIENEGVLSQIWDYGECMKGAFNDYASGLDGIECIGYPSRTFFNFPTAEHRSLFWQECLDAGVLFGYAQFICQAHGHAELEKTYDAMRKAVNMVRKYYDDPKRGLRGQTARATLRLR